MSERIAVVGGGPAGVTFALKLALESNYKIDLYCKSYGKACGEVVPEDSLKYMLVEPVVLNEICSHELRIEGSIKYKINSAARWFAIDKKEWINRMRKEALKAGVRIIGSWTTPESIVTNEYKIVVDARGPLSNNVFPKLIVGRFVVDCKIEDTAVLDFYPTKIGFAWIFPWGDKANVGAGFMSVKSPRLFIRSYASENLPKHTVLNEKYSLITIGYPSKKSFYSNYKIIRIGEAAGFVYPVTGEGIRPSIKHASEVASALARDVRVEELWSYTLKGPLSTVVNEIKSQYKILRAISRLGWKDRVECMNSLSIEFYRKLMKGQVDVYRGAIDVFKSSPSLAFKVLTSILL